MNDFLYTLKLKSKDGWLPWPECGVAMDKDFTDAWSKSTNMIIVKDGLLKGAWFK